MNERDRHREEQLERLFRVAGPESIPMLEPDPGLPARVRALAQAGERARATAPRRWTPRWAWVSMASAAVAGSILIGAYLGSHAAADLAAPDSGDEAEMFTAAWSQSGSSEALGDVYDDEVME
jgi:hypothetical protein